MIRIIVAFFAACGLYWMWSLFEPQTPEPAPSHQGHSGSLTAAEQQYYLTMFDYTMDNVQPGHSQSWSTHSANGRITVEEPFLSKSKSNCRRYTESIAFANKQHASQGVACKRQGDNGWCRLKENGPLTCAMESRVSVAGIPFQRDITLPSIGGTDTNVNIAIPSGNSTTTINPGQIQQPSGDAPSGESYADTVTGTAGAAAGPAASGALKWFGETFGR